MRGSWAAVVVLSAACSCCIAPAAASGAVSLQASATSVASGQTVTLSGQSAPDTSVQLDASPYPYAAGTTLASTSTAADGSFSFAVQPDRNTRYSVLTGDGDTSAAVEVDVIARVLAQVAALPLGRARVTLVVFHPSDLLWGGATVRWWFASGSGGTFAPAPSTTSFALSPYVAVLKTTVALPAGPFAWRACFRAPGDLALADPSPPAGCAGQGYQGSGSLPAGIPGPAALSRAASYLAARRGRTAFAVIDSQGRLAGVNVHKTFMTASIVKAMLLVGYLRRLDADGQRRVGAYSNSFLYPMIHVSDNDAATTCWSIVGDPGLYAVAAAAHMTDFSVSGLWGSARLSPADQARFFFELDSLIPKEFVGYARFLLSTIEPSQSWAIPAIARPLGYRVFFKDGSEPLGSAQLVHQVARLEGHGLTFSLAVMTDRDPTMRYGIDTIAGVTRALLR